MVLDADTPNLELMISWRHLSWPLIFVLGLAALSRPLLNIVADQVGWDRPSAIPVVMTVIITALWVSVVGFGRARQPVLTLVLVGLAYGVLATILSGILSPILTGELQGPLGNPIAILPMLIINGLWGAGAGVLALLLQRVRGVKHQAAH